MSLKMYVWSVHPKFFAVAQANSVAEARALLLQNDNIGESGDGSCVERDAAREHVLSVNPSIWHGPNAEFALTNSAELREQEDYSRELFERTQFLTAALATANARIAELEAERDREDIIIEVTIADRENMFICHVRGPVTVDQLLAINDDLFSNCDEQPFLGEPEDIAGARLKAVWVRDGYDDGYWDFTTIARCTYSAEAGEVWTPSDAARAGKARE